MKNLKTKALFIATTLGSLFAESISQDPSSYQAIPYVYKQLELSPSTVLHGRFNNDSREISEKSDNSSNSFDFQCTSPLTYKVTRSDSLKVIDISLRGTPLRYNGAVSKRTTEFDTQDGYSTFNNSSQFSSNLDFRFNTIWYAKPEKFFTGLDLVANFNGSTNGPIDKGHSSKVDTSWQVNIDYTAGKQYSGIAVSENRYQTQRAEGNTSLTLGVGYGRAYDITYSAVAIHICNYLKKENLLLNTSKSTVVEVSKVLEKLKRERVLDYREGQIRQITELTDMLEKEKISKPLNSNQTMEILDLWNYAFNQKRYKGSPLYAGIRGSVDFEYLYSDYENRRRAFDTIHAATTPMSKDLLVQKISAQDDSISTSYDKRYAITRELTPTIIFNYNKVNSMRSQFVLNANAAGGIAVEKVQETTEKKSYVFDTEISAKYFVYPSLRSDIELTTQFNYSKNYCNDKDFTYFNKDAWKADVSSQFEYYLSPKLSMVTKLSYLLMIHRNSDRDDKKDSYVNGNYMLSTGVVYKIF